jgi:ATP/maltotriose-dependent transcriptional regulator MalT
MISPPPPPSHAVDRAALRARLDGALDAPLTLLVAPAGSGKTVLLSQWAASRPDLRFLWLEVDRADDDPSQFLRRLLRGLSTLSPSARDLAPLMTIGAGGFGMPLLESLVALLAEHPGNVLMFDDLHNLGNRAIIADLWWLAEHAPEGTHIVFSSRVDLRLSWSAHRLRYALLELRQAELALDAESTASVLEHITGVPASAATVQHVLTSTEGWPAGVQLSAISLRHQEDPEQFARGLAGTDRLISDYLSEEVLSAQPEARREILLRLSALEAMSPALVEWVLGVPDVETIFDDLQRDSLFLVPLDDTNEWFRFHHLFRDLLRYRLRARDRDEEVRILTRTAQWHLRQGDIASAVEYHLRAHSWDTAIDLILTQGREVYERGETPSLVRWLEAVPQHIRRARPEAETLYGMVLGMSGDAARAEDVLREITQRQDVDTGLHVVAQSYVAARVQFRPHVAVSLQAAREAVQLLQENPRTEIPDLLGLTQRPLLLTLALGARGRAHFLAGEWDAAEKWLRRTIESPGGQYSVYRVHLLGSLALREAWCGRLTLAQELADEALGLARDVGLLVHPAPADAYLAGALVAMHRGRGEAGALALHEGAVRAASNQRTQLMWISHLLRTLAGDTTGPVAPEPRVVPPPIVAEGLTAAAERGRRLARHPPVLADARPRPQAWGPLLVEHISRALEDHRAAEARALLHGSEFEPRADVPIRAIEHTLLSGWLAHEQGSPAESRRLLSASLELAEREGLVSVFLWAGPRLIRLIESLPGLPTAFRTEVITRARERFRPTAVSDALTEPLTDREKQLLSYLPTRLTNAELAGQFFVSVNTVKTHMAHIYRKLDVANRSAAVAKATELGLL